MSSHTIAHNFHVLWILILLLVKLSESESNLSVLDTWTYDLPGTRTEYSTDVVVIDMFDTSESKIQNLKDSGRTVICYISAGSWENWRPDKNKFPKEVKGKNLDGWKGEKWLDVRDETVRSIMKERFAKAKDKGCKAIEPDNVDGWDNDTGFPLTKNDTKDYQLFLSTTAHDMGLLIGLKNTAALASEMQPNFDFAIVEECKKYRECGSYADFVKNDKPVFAIEYRKKKKKLCKKFKKMQYSLIFGNYSLKKLQFC